MRRVHFITHPDVVVDPTIPVPDWSLSAAGRRRMHLAARQPWFGDVQAIFCSAERKARDAADILAGHLQLVPVVLAALGENDRSASGYLPKAAFEATADRFFACPDTSVRGWERAVDAQHRIIGAVETAIAMAAGTGALAIVSHGAVGALFLCHLKARPITRGEDQPGEGGGHFYSFDSATGRLLDGWQRIEAVPSWADPQN